MSQRLDKFASPPGPSSHFSLTRWLWLTAGLSLLLRGWIAVTFPVTGDEAFFYWWGVHFDWGYYDHPPMVGWLIALMLHLLGDTTWSIRVPAVLMPLALGCALWWALKPLSRERAAWAVLLFWLTPFNWLNMLVTTDTPLIFWSMLSVASLMRAEQSPAMDGRGWALYAFSGFFLGCAFLSKYFSVVLGLTYAVYFVAYRRDRLLPFALLVLCAMHGPAINVAYNMSHGWSNIMFNVYNRNEGASFEWRKPLTYVVMMAYLVTPPALWLGWSGRRSLREALGQHRLLACLVLVPLGFFALLSLKKVIGLHWVMSFYPFGFALLAFALSRVSLHRAARGMAVFCGLHVIAVAGLYATQLPQWKSANLYPEIVQSYRTQALLDQVRAPGVVLMASSYSPAAIYGYTLRDYVPVWGMGDFHARQDDMLVDFSIYRGKTVRILHIDQPTLDKFQPYFDSVRLFTVTQDHATFYVVEGTAFNYESYRRGPLTDAYKQFYNIPQWLPMTGCPFCERLCGKVRCSP